MREFQEEQKRLHNAVRAAERDHRKAAKALQLETGKLDMRAAELDTAQRAEDDLHQQHVQATQVTRLSVTNMLQLAGVQTHMVVFSGRDKDPHYVLRTTSTSSMCRPPR